MSESSRIGKGAPNTWQVFRQDMGSLNTRFARTVTPFFDWAFALTKNGAERRSLFLIIVSGVLWIGLALIAHPPSLGAGSLLNQFIGALFAQDILRHVIILVLAMWLALRMASLFLDDIFELGNLSISENFIRSTAFSGYYHILKIKDGGVPVEYLESPIFRIGGPGKVDVHLENAALFERPDGTPHVISPTTRRYAILDGFERMRSVVDLRDQVVELTVDGRTQDGIPVTAKDVRLVYSIYRGAQQNESEPQFQQPYPFTDQAILDLVYKHGKDALSEAMRNTIRSELRNFISRHTLGEFLANASLTSSFVPREDLTDLFYDYAKEFSRQSENQGVELHWIGVGTWVTPSQIIPERQLEAWKISSENRARKSDQVITRMRLDNRLAELLRLIDIVPTAFYNLEEQDLQPGQIMRRLVLDYRENLREARDLYVSQKQPVPPELDAVIRHLTQLGAVRVRSEKP
ncbi:MAG: SPFH domain-containing protein [Omnitrophica WOR_2 bacterium]